MKDRIVATAFLGVVILLIITSVASAINNSYWVLINGTNSTVVVASTNAGMQVNSLLVRVVGGSFYVNADATNAGATVANAKFAAGAQLEWHYPEIVPKFINIIVDSGVGGCTAEVFRTVR